MKTKIILLLLFFCTVAVYSQKDGVFKGKEGAINGYDPVAYFNQNMPVKGKPELTFRWNDADWHFATAENLEAFKSAPEKFAPQYGGYCAYGTSQGYKAPTEPDAFTIVNNKLYLNYNIKVRESWMKNKEALIEKADNNWPKINGVKN